MGVDLLELCIERCKFIRCEPIVTHSYDNTTLKIHLIATRPNPLRYRNITSHSIDKHLQGNFGIVQYEFSLLSFVAVPYSTDPKTRWVSIHDCRDVELIVSEFEAYDAKVKQIQDQLNVEDVESIMSI